MDACAGAEKTTFPRFGPPRLEARDKDLSFAREIPILGATPLKGLTPGENFEEFSAARESNAWRQEPSSDAAVQRSRKVPLL